MTDFERALSLNFNELEDVFTEDMLEKVRQFQKIVIFGAGLGGAETFQILSNEGLNEKIVSYSDNDKKKAGKRFCGLPVIYPDLIATYYPEALILVSSTAFDVIKKQLKLYGIPDENIFFFQPHGLCSECDISFIKEHMKEYSYIYKKLQDAESKKYISAL